MIELRECIGKLSSADEADRMYAAEDIGYANQADGVSPLLARLPEERSRAVREAIFGALRQIEDDVVIEGGLLLLDSEDSFLRNQAVEILRARGTKAIPFLDRAFQNGNGDRRKFVIDVLARLSDAGASGIYERALHDPDLNVVITAVESLGNARQTGFREKVEALISPGVHPMLLCACMEALAQIGEETAVDTVRARLGQGTALPGYLQPSYLKLLGAKGRAEDVSEVAETIGRDGLEEAALNALTALRNRYGSLKLPQALAQPLQDVVSRKASPLLAYHAIRLLGRLLDEPAVFGFVERCLEDPEKSVRIGAVQSLREAGSKKADAALCQGLRNESDAEVLQAWSAGLGGKSAK
jgi:HEAT repeat protein